MLVFLLRFLDYLASKWVDSFLWYSQTSISKSRLGYIFRNHLIFTWNTDRLLGHTEYILALHSIFYRFNLCRNEISTFKYNGGNASFGFEL